MKDKKNKKNNKYKIYKKDQATEIEPREIYKHRKQSLEKFQMKLAGLSKKQKILERSKIAVKICQEKRMTYNMDYFDNDCPDCGINPYISFHHKNCKWDFFIELDDIIEKSRK